MQEMKRLHPDVPDLANFLNFDPDSRRFNPQAKYNVFGAKARA
jgi:hypothetical protein